MDRDDKIAIDGLFDRLRQAEAHAAPRDAAAEAHIRDTLTRQPLAPYYMAQVLLVQDHALAALHARVEQLEHDLANRPAGGGFLAGLFGGGQRPADGAPMVRGAHPIAGGMAPFQQAPRGSFLAGALQTAAGVAGGMVLGNLIGSMFAGDAQAAAPQAAPEPEQDGVEDFAFDGEDE